MKTKLAMLTKTVLQTTRHAPLITCLALALAPAAWADTASFTTPGTIDWVVPANVSKVTIECRGSGGAGGSAQDTSGTALSGGGAGGSYAKKVNLTVVAGTTYKVIVGAGGVGLTTGLVNGTVNSVQQGGSSSFTTSDSSTTYCLAVGGAGGKNAVNATPTASGGLGTTTGCIGDTLYAGGNGADAGSNGGGGGGGAGDANPGGNAVANAAGAGGSTGGGAGSGGRGNGGPNQPSQAGTAPGGGTGGVKSDTGGNINTSGAGGAGAVKLTYAIDTATDHYAVAATSPQTAGVAFNVTITAQDAANATVTGDINTITMTSSSGLMEFDWDSNGTFGDNSGTLVSGTKTIKARNKKAETATITAASLTKTTTTPPSVTTTADVFSKLQILAAGETAAPGTTPGKTGTASAQTYNVAFNVTVNAVDQYWNPVSATDTVGITSSDTAATLPANAALAAGTNTFAVTLNTIGSFTVTATDVTDGTKTAITTPAITVPALNFVWQGDGSANLWNTSALNWTNSGTSVAYLNGHNTLFNDTSANRVVDLVGTLTPGSITVSNSTGNYTFGSTGSGLIGGTGGLTKSGAGTLTLSTANTYTGGTTVSGGTLSVNTIADSSSSAIGNSGTLTLGGGTLSYSGSSAATTTRAVSLTATSTIELTNGSLTLSGAVTGNTLTKTGNGILTLSGSADNNSLFLNATAGEVELGKTSSGSVHAVSGITGIANGATVKLTGTGGDQINGGSSFNQGVNGLVAGGTLNLNGNSESLGFLNGTGGIVEGGSGTPNLTVGENIASSTFGGVIQNTRGTLSLVKSGGGGTLTLSGANTFTGTTTVSSGILTLNNNLALQNSALVTTGGGNINYGVNTPTFGGLSGASGNLSTISFVNSYINVQALTLNPLSGTVTFGGSIPNGGVYNVTLTKTGAGTQVLSGANTYSGITTISAGRLEVTGSLGATTVNVHAGTLAGSGNIGGNVNIASGAHHALAVAATPDSQVTRAITGTLTLTSGNILDLTGTPEPGEYVLATATVAITGTPTTVNYNGINGVVTVDSTSTPKRLLLTVNSADPYQAWAGAGVLFDADANNDGISNGLAWLLGASGPNVNALGLLPTITQTGGNLKLTFNMLPASARGTAQLFLEHSSNLGTWASVLVPDATGGTAPVTFVVSGTNPLSVEATVSSSEAVGAKLFGRLRAEK